MTIHMKGDAYESILGKLRDAGKDGKTVRELCDVVPYPIKTIRRLLDVMDKLNDAYAGDCYDKRARSFVWRASNERA